MSPATVPDRAKAVCGVLFGCSASTAAGPSASSAAAASARTIFPKPIDRTSAGAAQTPPRTIDSRSQARRAAAECGQDGAGTPAPSSILGRQDRLLGELLVQPGEQVRVGAAGVHDQAVDEADLLARPDRPVAGQRWAGVDQP